MRSMTGYGKAVARAEGRELTIELKSVNHRYLDISMKVPRLFIAHENIIREIISKNVARGHVDVYINYVVIDEQKRTVKADLELAKGYLTLASELSSKFKIKNDFNLNALMKTNDIVKVEEVEEDGSLLAELIKTALTQAVCNLNEMRDAEGERLKTEILLHIDEIEKCVKKIKEFAPSVAYEYRAKIEMRIREVLGSIELDESRLLNEVAFFADKCNIDEEIARLNSHIVHAKKIINEEGAGRKLDFLVQELNREVNTVCSKSNNVSLTNIALQIKNEIEKVREQVQNVQ